MFHRSLSSLASLDLFETLLDVAFRKGLLNAQEVNHAKRNTHVHKQAGSVFSHIHEKDILDINNLLAERWGGPEVGVALALKADVIKLGVIGEVIALSETPYDAFYQVSRFSRLLHQSSTFEITKSTNRLSMVRQYTGNYLEYQQAIEVGMFWALAHIALIPKSIFNADISPFMTKFECVQPSDTALIKSVFGESIYFEQNEMSVSFKLAALKNIRRDPYRLLGVMESVAQSGLNEIITDSLSSQVKAYLNYHLEGVIPNQKIFAKSIGLSVRSLQRKLADEGSSFRMIFEEVRRQKANKLLSDERVSISEIAFRLGYAEQAAFTHAVKRWFGHSPREIRKNL